MYDRGEIDEVIKAQVAGQTVRYGDRIKIWAKSSYLKDMEGSYDKKYEKGGYLGVYSKPDRPSRVLVPPVGKDAIHGVFEESVFRLEDPRHENQRSSKGKPLLYGDPVVMIDQHGLVWNNKSGGFFDSYLGPKPRGSGGELYISFQKNGQDRNPVLFGDIGVYIDVEDSHRYRSYYNQRLTNYKSSGSHVVGGYVCSDGSGFEMTVSLHRYSGSVEQMTTSQIEPIMNVSVESINVWHPKFKKEDVMRVSPTIGNPILLYGVRKSAELRFKLSGGEMIKMSCSKLYGANSSNSIVIQPKVNSERPMLLNLSWQKIRSSDEGADDQEKSLSTQLLAVLLSTVQLIGCFAAVLVMFPILVKAIHPLFLELLGLIEPLADQILGPNMTSLVASHTDRIVTSSFPAEGSSLTNPNLLVVVLALGLCFLTGLFTPACIHGRNVQGAGSSSADEDGQEEAPTRWTIVPNLEYSDVPIHDSASAGPAETDMGAWRNAGTTEDGTPKHPAWPRFLAGEKGDREKALRRWQTTCDWRFQGDIDNILLQPHPKFDVIKRYYPHYYIGLGKNGSPIYLDQPTKVQLKALKNAGVKMKDLLFHFVYITEFLWTVLEPSEEGRTISLLDVKGLGVRQFIGEVRDYVQKTMSLSQEHYPERSHRIYVINAPGVFKYVFSAVKAWMAPETVQKISISNHEPTMELFERDIDPEVLPTVLGGRSTTPLAETEMEKLLRNTVYRQLKKSNEFPIDDNGKPVEVIWDELIDENIPDKLENIFQNKETMSDAQTPPESQS